MSLTDMAEQHAEVVEQEDAELVADVEHLKAVVDDQQVQIESLQTQIVEILEIARENHDRLVQLTQQPRGMVSVRAPGNTSPWQEALARLPQLGEPSGHGECPTHGHVNLNSKGRCCQCSTAMTQAIYQERSGVPV
jgi:hypothetical protein